MTYRRVHGWWTAEGMERLQGLNMPLCTLLILAVCGLLQLCVFVFDVQIAAFTLSAQRVLYHGEAYRVVSAALFHGGFLHILMNMMSTAAIGGALERGAMGTARFALTVGRARARSLARSLARSASLLAGGATRSLRVVVV